MWWNGNLKQKTSEMKFKDLEGFAPDSKVWVFVANRKLINSEVEKIRQRLKDYCVKWVSHSDKLKAEGFVVDDVLILLAVDNKMYSASGCSIDSAMRFIQELEREFNVELLDRQNFAYVSEGKSELVKKSDLRLRMSNGEISGSTLFYNPLVSNFQELQSDFLKPMDSFWMKNMV